MMYLDFKESSVNHKILLVKVDGNLNIAFTHSVCIAIKIAFKRYKIV